MPDAVAGSGKIIEKGDARLNLEQIGNGSALPIALRGRLDTAIAPELETTLGNAQEGVEKLIFDLEKLDYISSAGLRVPLSAQRTMNRQDSMKALHANEIVTEIFEVTGFTDIPTIE